MYLVRGELNDDEVIRLQTKRLGTGVLPSANYRMGTYEELVSVGKINLLRNPDLRKRLQEFAALRQRVMGQLDYFRRDIPWRDQIIDRAKVFSLDEEGRVSSFLDLNGQVGRQDYISAFMSARGTHLLLGRYRRSEMDSALKVLNLVNCELGLPDCNAGEAP